MAFEKGEQCLWLHTPPGGYGYTYRIAARVLELKGPRARIQVRKAKTGELVERWVLQTNLRKPGEIDG